MYDIAIIGGGIVGLATAFQIKKQNPNLKLCLIEKESQLAQHQTGRNSGVIHSGIYYKPGSLKASNCIRGYELLLEFCRTENIQHDLCGKVIVATHQKEIPALNKILDRGQQNGLKGLKRLTKDEIAETEPYVNGLEGIWVPQTGIIDFTEVALKLGEKIAMAEGEIYLDHQVIEIRKSSGNSVVITNEGEFKTKLIVNCAGLYSDKIAEMTLGTDEALDVKIVPFRGEYYKLKKEKEYLVRNLVYPVPDPAFPFLGVHFTRMMEGGIEAGPNAVLALAREGYEKNKINFNELRETLQWRGFQKVASKYWKTGIGEMYRSYSKKAFTRALQNLIPDVQIDDLVFGGAGVRAQACDKHGGLIDDFVIMENKHAVNVCNAPSPAATSSLAIGETISLKVLDRL